MANLHAVSRDRHQEKKWIKNTNYLFAKNDAFCPISSEEVSKAALSLPLAFSSHDGAPSLICLLGLEQAKNLLIDDYGNWLIHYIPNAFHCYPFSLFKNEDKYLLCIDEDIALSPDNETGEEFFTEDGEPVQLLQDVLNFLSRHANSLAGTLKLCQQLEDVGVIEPWNIAYNLAGKNRKIQGLSRINESALNVLDPEQFIQLRNSGALALAYAQLLSMGNINRLKLRIQEIHSVSHSDLNFDKSGSDTLNFDNL